MVVRVSMLMWVSVPMLMFVLMHKSARALCIVEAAQRAHA